MVSSRKDLKLLRNPSCDSQNLFRLGAAINFDRYANENSLPPPPAAARRLAPARACLGQVLSNKKETVTKTVTVSFWQGQKDLNPRHAVLETAALPTELYPYICEAPKIGASWWATRDSNPGPFGYEPSALTN